ncbi:iron ABC transporter permease [Bosea caraganae]|uniref:Iron ABC transporter permease n=1 Tax=Bosea caraganae TaxID=2763117 RepID=A0A370L2G0_9HYPH|nr:iron ABC transporter permease [Bosea caraganae]RDJ22422.1 iron ABC transporter permease [Bosea caraganae]RDJ30381.1 iron ABC transporter permease [Bosea caraganae]
MSAAAVPARATGAAGLVWGPRLTSLALQGLLGLLVIYPIGMLVVGAFTPGDTPSNGPGSLGLDSFRILLTDFEIGRATANTLVIAGAASVLATVIGVAFAWVVTRTDAPWRRGIEIASLLPIFVPPLVAGIAWSFLGSPTTGMINLALKAAGAEWRVDFYSLPGMIFVFGIYNAPYVYLFVRPAFAGLDSAMEEAALMAGANARTAFTTITLPLLAPSIMAGALLAFVVMLGTYGIPGALGTPGRIPVLSTTLYRLVSGTPPQYNVAAALALILMAATGLVILAKRQVMRGRSYVTITAKARPARRIALGALRWPVFATAMLYLLVATVLPTLMLAIASLRRFLFFKDIASLFDLSQYTLDHFHALWAAPATLRSIVNAIELGAISAVVGGVLAFVFAYAVHRSRLPGRAITEILVSLPVAVPSLVIGVAYLWAMMGLPINLYGTITIMAVALVARFLPDAMQALSTSLLQIHRDLEEASWVCGRSVLGTVAAIVVPLARPGIAAAAMLLFILALRELGSTLFLFTNRTQPLSIYLLTYFEAGNISATAALCIVQIALLAAVLGIAGALTRRPTARTRPLPEGVST